MLRMEATMHFTTNHHSRPKSVSNPSIDDEACRRLMISLYGSEAAAVAAAQALAQELTPEEEALVRQLYEADNEIARQVAREVGPPDETRPP